MSRVINNLAGRRLGMLLALAFGLPMLLGMSFAEPVTLEAETTTHIECVTLEVREESASPRWEDCDAPMYIFSLEEIEALAKLLYGEARNCNIEGQAAAVWCVLNRVDDERYPDSVLGVITQENHFFGYREDYPVLPELVELVEDVLRRYNVEAAGIESAGRVLPREYLFFSGDGTHNYFTKTYNDNDVWEWELRSPYRDE